MASNALMFAILASACAFATWSGVEPALLRSSRSGGPELADSWEFRSCRSRILAPSSADRRAQPDARSRAGSVPSTYWLSHTAAHSTKAIGPFHEGWDPERPSAKDQRHDGRLTGPRGAGGGDATRTASAWHHWGMSQADTGRRRESALKLGQLAFGGVENASRMRAEATGWFVNRSENITPGRSDSPGSDRIHMIITDLTRNRMCRLRRGV
jgi:hypothetical protein